MKTLLMLLLSISVTAQELNLDKIIMYNDVEYDCIITAIESKKIHILYKNQISETVILDAIKKIEMEKFGAVYETNKGFTADLNAIEEFIEKRNEAYRKLDLAKKELEKLNSSKNELSLFVHQDEVEDETLVEKTNSSKSDHQKRWSFSAILVPYYSGIVQDFYYNEPPYYNFSPYTMSKNEINMIWMASYLFYKNISLTLDFAYSSEFSENRDEYHSRGTTINDQGTKVTSSMALYNFNFGVKYYFLESESQDVNIFALAGFGKQFAAVTSKQEILFLTPQTTYSEDNDEEYLRQMNSPWLLNFGFGAEYFFNRSLSLTALVRFSYSATSGTFKTRFTSPTQNYSTSSEVNISSVINRIGLGFNFYF